MGFVIGSVVWTIVAIVLVIFLSLLVMVRSYKKVPPNRAMIIFGFGGKKVVQGGGAFVMPGVQSSRSISMTLMSFDVLPEQAMFSMQGVALSIEAVAQIKIKSEPRAILTACEQFLDRKDDERERMILHSIEGHLRGIVGQLSVESILKTPDEINSKMRETCSEDLDKMGLEVVSFTIKKVMDSKGYIDNLGVPEIERVRRDASIAKAEAERDIAINKSSADKAAAIAVAKTQQERIEAESTAQQKQAEYQKELSVKEATIKQEVEARKAEADMAYELQKSKIRQQIVIEEVRVTQVEAEAKAKVREAEILVRERELEATMIKPAQAETQALTIKAEGERTRQILQAEAAAEVTRKRGEAEAAVEQVLGATKAQVTRLEGLAEAEALGKKALAYREYTQAAIVIEMLRVLPELAERIAAPLTQVDKITVISQDGATSGVNRVTADVARIMAQVPELTEALTGYPFGDAVRQLVGQLQGGFVVNEAPSAPPTPAPLSSTSAAPVEELGGYTS